VIVAFSVFLLVRQVNKLVRKPQTPEEKKAPAARECPYCLSMISSRATRCANCTSTLEAAAVGKTHRSVRLQRTGPVGTGFQAGHYRFLEQI